MGHPRTALVTGGMGGLGEAIARTLHDAGHTVLVTHSRSDEAASTWLKKEADAGYTFVSYDVDVSDWISCRRMGQRIVADDKLRAVFGKDSAGMFELAGILGNHLGGDA